MLKCHTRTRSPDSPPPRSPRPPNPPPWPIKKKKKKKEGRKKGEPGPLPSNKHPDIEQPSLAIVERALKPFIGVTKRWSVKYLAPPLSAYHDEQGRMMCKGSSGGRYRGDVAAGLPHGIGQHWVPTSRKDELRGKEHLLYEGDWALGQKTGNGNFYYLNGQVSPQGLSCRSSHCVRFASTCHFATHQMQPRTSSPASSAAASQTVHSLVS